MMEDSLGLFLLGVLILGKQNFVKDLTLNNKHAHELGTLENNA